jgi:protein-S-isoprenylcysteine O-methyltransferase Ste14
LGVAYRADHVQRTVLGGGWAPFVVGYVILVLGIGFRLWAIVTLGRFFTGQVAIQATGSASRCWRCSRSRGSSSESSTRRRSSRPLGDECRSYAAQTRRLVPGIW